MKLNKTDKKLLAQVIIGNLDSFDSSDLFFEFIDNKKRKKRVEKLEGDVDTNPEIEEYEQHGTELIELTIRNLKKHIKEFLPLWLTKMDTNHDLCEVCGTKRFMKGTCTKKVTCEDLKLIYNDGKPMKIAFIGKDPGKRVIKKETVKKYFSS